MAQSIASRAFPAARAAGFRWRQLAVAAVLAVGCAWQAPARAQDAAKKAPPPAQGAVKNKFGDWTMLCATPPGASHEQCSLMQLIADETKPNVHLVVVVMKTADGKARLLRVIAPLGVLLPAGLGLKIDQADVGRAGFVRCYSHEGRPSVDEQDALKSGCVAEVVMEDKLINQFSTGQTATFIIFDTPEGGIGIPMALAGFKDGFSRLP
jgi:invasion protein IalB